MIIRILAMIAVAVASLQAGATKAKASEVLYCQFFQAKQPKSLLKWNMRAGTIETITGANRQHKLYKDVDVFRGLAPYDEDNGPAGPITNLNKNQLKRGFSLVVFGDVPAIHIRKIATSTWSDQCLMYPYEAYWGLIPGQLEAMNWLDGATMGDFGPRGVCYTKDAAGLPVDRCGSGDHGGSGDHNKGGHSCNRGGKGGEGSSSRGK
jgi:hypothetical protein